MDNEDVIFEFYVRTWDIDTYKQREEFVAELKSKPNLEVSSKCVAAGSSGMEEHLITIIATMANILTIANFLYGHFRKTKKNKRTKQPYLVAYVPQEDEIVSVRPREIVLNDLTKQEIIKLIETSSSYSYSAVIMSPQKSHRKVRRLHKTRKGQKASHLRNTH